MYEDYVVFFVSAAYFYYIAEALVKQAGYTRDVNIRGAPYDFRKAPSKCLWAGLEACLLDLCVNKRIFVLRNQFVRFSLHGALPHRYLNMHKP